MTARTLIPPPVLDAGAAVGVLDAAGNIDADWFEDPLSRIRSVLADPDQRDALLRLVSALAPAERVADSVAWHPIGGPLSLTVERSGPDVVVGIGVQVGAPTRFSAHLTVARIRGDAITLAESPVGLELEVPLDWTRPTHAFALRAIRVAGRIGPGQDRLTVVLDGLDLDGNGPGDRVIDSVAGLGGEAELVVALLVEELRQATGAVAHLAALLGLADGIPPLPIAALADADSVRSWLAALSSGAAPAAPRWIAHLAALLGAAESSAGAGTRDDPWRATVLAFDESRLAVTLAAEETAPGERRLVAGLALALVTASRPLGVDVAVALAAVPLSGAAPVVALPAARAAVRTELDGDLPIRVIEAGLRFSREGGLVPILLLRDVTVAGAHYDLLDLSSASSVIAAAADVLAARLGALLGPRLGALVGLVSPSTDPTATRRIDPIALASGPLDALAAFHRAVLADPVHGWSHLLAELGALLGVSAPVTGAGDANDPWRVPIAESGRLSLELAAWRDGDALRVGLRASSEGSLWGVHVHAALIAVELPAGAGARLSLLGNVHAEALLSVPPLSPRVAGTQLRVGAASAGVSFDWSPGSSLAAKAFIRDAVVDDGPTPIVIPSIEFPSSAPFDPASLGLGNADLNRVFVAIAGYAARTYGGRRGEALAGLLGLAKIGNVPTLADAASGSVLTDPGAAVREWLAAVSRDPALLPALLGALVDLDHAPGRGVADDPWSVPLGSSVELTAWLSPGAPAARLAAIDARLTEARDFVELLSAMDELAAYVPDLREAMAGRSIGLLTGSLMNLARHFAESDGVVRVAAQAPAGWTTRTVTSAHGTAPAAAASEVAAQIEAWTTGTARVVLFLSAPFRDSSSWAPMLGALGAAGAPHFDLRRGDAALDDVALAAEHYTADLRAEDEAGQIDRLLGRLEQIAGDTPVVLVAHSTTGVSARQAAAARPARVRGLITLASPHGGEPLAMLRDPNLADTLRFLQRLGEHGVGSGRLAEAAGLLFTALDGWVAGAPGDLPRRAPWPLTAFEGAPLADPGVPTLAIVARLDADLFAALRDGALAMARAVAPSEPSHLVVGARGIVLAGPDVDLRLSAAVARIALDAAAPVLAMPAWRLEARAVVTGADGWLAGTPGDTMQSTDARARYAELGAVITPDAVVPFARLHDAAWRAPVEPVIDLGRPAAAALLGQLITAGPLDMLAPRRRLLEMLEALGVAVRAADGTLTLAQDAIDALSIDAREFFTARLDGAALARAVGSGRASIFAVGALDLEVIGTPRSALGVRTRGDELALGDAAVVHASGRFDASGAELSAELVISAFHLVWSAGRLTVGVDDWLDPVTLIPSTPEAVRDAARAIALRLLVSAGVGALLEPLLPAGLRTAMIDRLVSAPGTVLGQPRALGNGNGGGFDAARIARLFDIVAGLLELPEGPGVPLTDGLSLTVTSERPGESTIALVTTEPLGEAGLDVEARVTIGAAGHVSVGGRVAATFALPGEWPSIEIALVADADGFTLDATPAGAAPIHLWPAGGLGVLAGAADALLPAALDALVGALRARGAPSALLLAVLDVAAALDCYDDASGFAGHAAELRGLADRGLAGAFDRAALAGAVVRVLTEGAGGVPGTFATDGTRVVWTHFVGGGDAELVVDMDGPDLAFTIAGLRPAGSAIEVTASIDTGARAAAVVIDLDLDGLPSPRLAMTGAASGLEIALLPLGAGTDTALRLALAPDIAVHVGPSGLRDLALDWAVPLAAKLLLRQARPRLAELLWTGGPTIGAFLSSTGIATPAGELVDPRPSPLAVVRGLVQALPSEGAALTSRLRARPASDGDRVGIRIVGSHAIQVGAVRAELIAGQPSTFVTDADRGLTLFLFDGETFRPALAFVGVGLGLTGAEGRLVDADPVRLDAVRGYLFGELALDAGLSTLDVGAGIELDGVGLPLGALASSGSNPVVAGLLGGGGDAPGDRQSVAPAVNIALFHRGDGLRFQIAGKDGVVWIPVGRSFGPIFVDQIGVEPTPDPGVGVLVDGSVRLGGLLVALDDLELAIPFRGLGKPGDWRVDLRGLGVTFAAAGVTVSGALRKSAGAPPAYDGFVLATVAGRNITGIGSYAVPVDPFGRYASFFAFVAMSTPLGGPPPLFVTALAGGAGYNRGLEPPAEVRDVEQFVLVRAMDDSSLASDPGRALSLLSSSIPPRRGSAFLAAGARFTSYGFVRSTVVATVELSRGVEVNVLGLSRMQLPRTGRAIANIELAMRARYSSEENVLSVIAELTDKSWIIDRDCQLTGGYAFAIWFDDGQAVLTLGGYHPDFVKPERFPDVPRLGFNWRVSNRIVVKGEAYFALTSTCVMVGGRLEATYEKGSTRAWFTTHANVLVSWDPFRYDFEIGVSVGASWRVRACFIKCVTITFSISIGADLRIRGPALRGTVTVHLGFGSVSFDFGSEASRPNYLPSFDAFAAKYLTGAEPVSQRVAHGLLAARAPGPPPTGSPEQPWRVTGEFVLVSDTRMPADHFAVSTQASVAASGAAPIDLAPLGERAIGVGSAHRLVFEARQGVGWEGVPLGDARRQVTPVMGFVPEGMFRFRAEDDEEPAARTVPALVGVRLDARAEERGERAPVRLVDLVDSTARTKPLPFAAPLPERLEVLDALGVKADELAGVARTASTDALTRAARALLSSDDASVRARTTAGLPGRGLSPVALAGLRKRSAPPVVAPLGTGLTRRSPAMGTPTPRPTVADVAPVLEAPRLRAVLALPPAPMRDVPTRLTTTVSPALAGSAPRMAVPVGGIGDAVRVAAPTSLRPTRAAVLGRVFRSGETGVAVAPRARLTLREVERAARTGVVIPAGVTQLWDLPAKLPAVELRGDGAVRLTFLGRGGIVLDDREMTMPRSAARVSPPPGATALAASCLGTPPTGLPAIGGARGAVSRRAAPAGAIAATGWENGNRAILVAPATVLARGAWLRLVKPTRRALGIVELADVVSEAAAAETWLPADTGLVVVLLEGLDDSAVRAGDLALSVSGGELEGPVARSVAGRRRALAYRVRASAAPLTIGVASRSGFAVAGVIGLSGRVEDFAERFATGVPEGLVSDEPLSAHGTATLRFIEEG
jgi:Family of unknown function (DUF6603)